MVYHTGKETKEGLGLGFSKTLLKTAINYLIQNYHYNDENMTMKQ